MRQNFDHVRRFCGPYMRHCDRGGSVSPHSSQIANWKAHGCVLQSSSQSPALPITCLFNKHVSSTHHRPVTVLSSHFFPDLSLTPVFAPVCLCLSHPRASAPWAPYSFQSSLSATSLPPHITYWACFPWNTKPTSTLLSLCPFSCFRGTCLDSGPLGGKRGEKRGLRPWWVGEEGQKQLEVAEASLHEPALM